MFPAIFLDRDGVIIENRDNYVRSWADVSFLEGALPALKALNGCSYKIILVTNQSAVGRGLMPLELAEEINQRVVDVIVKNGGRVDGVFMCPHSPADNCDCRKPRPGLILQAASALSLDLSRSVMVGDALSDLQAGQTAGVARLFLVRTGRGAVQAALPGMKALKLFELRDSLADVVMSL